MDGLGILVYGKTPLPGVIRGPFLFRDRGYSFLGQCHILSSDSKEVCFDFQYAGNPVARCVLVGYG